MKTLLTTGHRGRIDRVFRQTNARLLPRKAHTQAGDDIAQATAGRPAHTGSGHADGQNGRPEILPCLDFEGRNAYITTSGLNNRGIRTDRTQVLPAHRGVPCRDSRTTPCWEIDSKPAPRRAECTPPPPLLAPVLLSACLLVGFKTRLLLRCLPSSRRRRLRHAAVADGGTADANAGGVTVQKNQSPQSMSILFLILPIQVPLHASLHTPPSFWP